MIESSARHNGPTIFALVSSFFYLSKQIKPRNNGCDHGLSRPINRDVYRNKFKVIHFSGELSRVPTIVYMIVLKFVFEDSTKKQARKRPTCSPLYLNWFYIIIGESLRKKVRTLQYANDQEKNGFYKYPTQLIFSCFNSRSDEKG